MLRIGVQFDTRAAPDAESLLADFEVAEAEGFDSLWIGQIFAHDVLTLFAMAGLRTKRIELGTSVVPLPTRHVATLAQQALTTQLASRNRLCLGVGSGHAVILQKKLGLDGDRMLSRTRETLEVLRPLLRGEYVKYAGEFERVRVDTPVPGTEAPPVILAALGPRMIELAGELADGVTLVFAGPDFIAGHVASRLPAGKRIVASVPVALTDRGAAIEELVNAYTAPSMALAPYQRTMQTQGFERVSELAIVGNEQTLEAGLARLDASGATDLNPILVSGEADPECASRTRAFLAERARRGRGET
ncbi:MAG: LLM class flavin-dependent oxidoreductase [Myxococcota bacterium]